MLAQHCLCFFLIFSFLFLHFRFFSFSFSIPNVEFYRAGSTCLHRADFISTTYYKHNFMDYNQCEIELQELVNDAMDQRYDTKKIDEVPLILRCRILYCGCYLTIFFIPQNPTTHPSKQVCGDAC